MKVALLLLTAFVCLACHLVLATKNHRSAAVPKKKSSHGIGGNIFGNRALKGLMRDVKMTFSSPLELVALQITRPDGKAVSLSQLDELATFVELEGENPEVLVSAIGKLSRKFAEPNIFTQIKSLFSLHYVSSHAGAVMSQEWSKAVVSLAREVDAKTGSRFFDLDAIDEAKGQAESSLELELSAFEEEYAEYLFEVLKHRQLRGAPTSSGWARATANAMKLWTDGKGLLSVAEQIEDSPLVAQIVDLVENDLATIEKQLLVLYETKDADRDAAVVEKLTVFLKQLGHSVGQEAKATDAPASFEQPSAVADDSPSTETDEAEVSVPATSAALAAPRKVVKKVKKVARRAVTSANASQNNASRPQR